MPVIRFDKELGKELEAVKGRTCLDNSNIAELQLRKIDRPGQQRILDWLNDRIEG